MKFAVDNGIIDIALIQQQIDMKKREEILEKHPYEIFFGKDGYWHTYLPTDGKRKAVKRKRKEDVENIIIENAKQVVEDEFFKKRFDVWVDRQKKCGRSDNTIAKYLSDYRRFFQGDAFENMNISDIDEVAISEYMNRLLTNKNIPYRALKSMFGYIKGVFDKSIRDKVVQSNPCNYVDLPLFKKMCHEKVTKAEDRVVSEREKRILINKINANIDSPTYNIARLAVELAFYTGMRVGELAGLRWSDIDYTNNVITIQHSEKQNKLTREYFISTTKNDKVRFFPITGDIKRVLAKIKRVEMNRGCVSEFVFSDNNGKIHIGAISNTMRNMTETSEFDRKKSIHAIRRTLNSNLRCNGTSATVAASLLGHTEKVNEENYTYDIVSIGEKAKMLERAYIG